MKTLRKWMVGCVLIGATACQTENSEIVPAAQLTPIAAMPSTGLLPTSTPDNSYQVSEALPRRNRKQ
jgi:hypothetical protein